MRLIVATFPTEGDAGDFIGSLVADFDVQRRAIERGTIGAYGEPFHGHVLVATWVRRELETAIRASAERRGGLVHDIAETMMVRQRADHRSTG